MNDYTRREFMTKPLAYLASAGLMGMSAEGLLKAAETASVTNLIMRPLGKTGISLLIVSMGVMNAEAPGLIIKSYEVGIRHFDTAAGYQGGRNEEMVGQVIRQLGVRDKVLISTKAHVRSSDDADQTKAEFLKVFEGSLSRLQMDHVETLYLHGAHDAKSVNDAGVQAAMTQLKKDGKIRWCGVSTHGGQAEVLNALAASGFYDVALVAFNYTMADNQALLDAMQLCASKGMGITAMKTQAGGSKPKREETYASETQKSVRQSAVLKWVLQHPFITTAIPGFTKFEQVDEDIPVASNIAFTDDERNFLENNTIKASLEFCQQCGDCVATCSGRVDVPTLMRTHMYAFDYQNTEHARITLAEVEKGKGLDACGCCKDCTAKCSHTVNIRRKIEALKTINLA